MRTPRGIAPARLATLAAGLLTAATALAEGGSVTGQVTVQPARYQDETVVYLKDGPAAGAPRTHEVDQRNMKFRPLVLAIAAGDSVRFLNHDGVVHNVHSNDGEKFNLGNFKTDEERTHTFAQPGAYQLQCNIHPEMSGWIFVAPSRYAAVIDRKGRFTIDDVPPGAYRLAVWNATLQGPEKAITVEAGQVVEERITLRR